MNYLQLYFIFFGKARAFACTYLFDHKNRHFWPMVYCLETDPNELIKLSYYDLKENEKARKFLRAIPLKHPVILNISFSQKEPMYAQIGMQKLQERAKIIKDNPNF